MSCTRKKNESPFCSDPKIVSSLTAAHALEMAMFSSSAKAESHSTRASKFERKLSREFLEDNLFFSGSLALMMVD